MLFCSCVNRNTTRVFAQGCSRQKYRLPRSGDPVTVAFSSGVLQGARQVLAEGRIRRCASDSALRATAKRSHSKEGETYLNSCQKGCGTAMETIFKTTNNWFGKFCCSVKENIVTRFAHCCISQEYFYGEKIVVPSGRSAAQASCTLSQRTERRPALVSQHSPGWDTTNGQRGKMRRHQLTGLRSAASVSSSSRAAGRCVQLPLICLLRPPNVLFPRAPSLTSLQVWAGSSDPVRLGKSLSALDPRSCSSPALRTPPPRKEAVQLWEVTVLRGTHHSGSQGDLSAQDWHLW